MLGSEPNTGVTVTTRAPPGIVPAAAPDGQTASPIATPAATALTERRVRGRRQRSREGRVPAWRSFTALRRAARHRGSGATELLPTAVTRPLGRLRRTGGAGS